MNETKRLRLIVEAVRYCKRVKKMHMPLAAYTKALREPVFYLWEKPKGSKVRSAKFRSKDAVGLRFGDGRLVYDHAIPFNYLQDRLLGLRRPNTVSVRKVLNKFCVAALITKREDRRLDAAGYRSKMPKRWNRVDPLARYNAVRPKIKVVRNGTIPN